MSCCPRNSSLTCWVPPPCTAKPPCPPCPPVQTSLTIMKIIVQFFGTDATFIFPTNPPIGATATITTVGGTGMYTTTDVVVGQTYTISEIQTAPQFPQYVKLYGPSSFTINPGMNFLVFINVFGG